MNKRPEKKKKQGTSFNVLLNNRSIVHPSLLRIMQGSENNIKVNVVGGLQFAMNPVGY